ncbi:MAG: 16S rRNA (guanine(527)-N(7))-methyltransferase RsmG [Lachnospiraceae bacterium]
MVYDLEPLKMACRNIDIELTDAQLSMFFSYYDKLMEKNKVMNLTTITELDEVIEKHFLDSLFLVKGIDLSKINTIIDVGTGAGFPGIPLKIVFPHLNIVLMDSLKKRLKFLDDIILDFGLTGIKTVHGRAEDLGQMALYREQFDLCVSRAVSNLSTLSEYCLPFVKQEGYFISYKSGDIDAELKEADKAISVLGGGTAEVILFTLPKSESLRSFVKIKKVKHTPKLYPRQAGTPNKEPIKK